MLTTYTHPYHIKHWCVRLNVSFDSKFKKMFIVPDWLISSEYIDRKTRFEIYTILKFKIERIILSKENEHILWNSEMTLIKIISSLSFKVEDQTEKGTTENKILTKKKWHKIYDRYNRSDCCCCICVWSFFHIFLR